MLNKPITTYTTLGWLYLVQGIPYGIQDKFIPIHLRSQGLQFSRVSLMKILLIPWLTKGLWAPFLQAYYHPKTYLSTALLGLAASAYYGSTLLPEDLFGLCCVLFVLNVFSAIQDVIVDGMALDTLHHSQFGLGNSVQIVLYKIGCLVGGAGLIHLFSYSNWSVAFCVVSALYLTTLIWSLFCTQVTQKDKQKADFCRSHGDRYSSSSCNKKYDDVRKGNITNYTQTDGCTCAKNLGAKVSAKLNSSKLINKSMKEPTNAIGIFVQVFNSERMLPLALFVLTYKMGERGAINNFPLFLLDKGMSLDDLAFWNGTVCQILSILGSLIGGFLMPSDRQGIIDIIKKYSDQRLLSIMFCYVLVNFWDRYVRTSATYSLLFHGISIVSLSYLNYTSGVVSTATFTLMMHEAHKCSSDVQAAHYSLIASFEVAGKLLFATLSGFVIDEYGMVVSFFLFGLLALLPTLQLRHYI